MFIHLKSTDNDTLFPKNGVLCFTVKLPERIILNTNGSRRGWKCALTEMEIYNPPSFVFHGTTKKPNTIYIGSDIVETSYTAFGQVPILRKLSMHEIKKSIIEHQPEPPPLPSTVYRDGDVVQYLPTKYNADTTPLCRQVLIHPHVGYFNTSQQKTGYIKEFSSEYIPVRTLSFSTIQVFLRGDDWQSLALSDDKSTQNSFLYAVLHLKNTNND